MVTYEINLSFEIVTKAGNVKALNTAMLGVFWALGMTGLSEKELVDESEFGRLLTGIKGSRFEQFRKEQIIKCNPSKK